MTDEQINAAIAEACGWTEIYVEDFSEMGVPCFMTMGIPPMFIHIENALALPDYCTELNAMHEAQQKLSLTEFVVYIDELMELHHEPMQSTARQRAEAFLRTLGKWEEVQG